LAIFANFRRKNLRFSWRKYFKAHNIGPRYELIVTPVRSEVSSKPKIGSKSSVGSKAVIDAIGAIILAAPALK
jgi:hypothetical protein